MKLRRFFYLVLVWIAWALVAIDVGLAIGTLS